MHPCALTTLHTQRRANPGSTLRRLYGDRCLLICSNCGSDNPEGQRFCNQCGNALAATCPACGASNPPGSRFCGQCATPLSEEAAAPEPPSPVPVTAERRLVSVLFADLVGYTPFSENRDAEEVRGFLLRYFDRARETVERFGGVVDKFIGDAVMAVWGAGVANEDDAERAVRAGMELTDVVAKLSADVGAPDLALRVGVLTGEAAVSPGGNEKGLVVGDMVNTTSRLQSIADPGTVLVGDATYQATRTAIAYQEVGPQTLKGKTSPVPAWRAMRVIAERGGRGRTDTLEPPFVGRADELRLLKDLLGSVGRDRRARLVSMVGEAGIGKSRMIWELQKYADGLVENVYWHQGRSPSYGDGVTLWAVAEMIRRRARIAEDADPATTEDALRACLEEYIADPEERSWVESRLSAVLGISELSSGDRGELDAAVRTFFERISERGTTVLVFEDLHWADTGLLDMVEELAEWSRDHPLLVITLARPDLLERRPSWGAGRRGFVSLHLGPLIDEEMTALVNGTVPGIPEEAVEAIVARASGVPLYAVELLRMLLADGTLEEVEGGYRLTGEIAGLAVPESLQAVVGSRLDRLDVEDRTLLQDASVLGQVFHLEGLSAITGIELEELEDRLGALARRELVEPIRDPRSPERGQFRFVQGLTREVALSRMGRDARRARHLAAANYLDSLGDPELAGIVASHYLDAYRATPDGQEAEEVRERALTTLTAAVARAAELRSHDQVISIAENALELTGEDSERAPLWEQMAQAASALARREDAEQYAQKALDHYRAVDDRQGAHRAAGLLGLVYVDGQQAIRAIELIEPVLAAAGDEAGPELAAASAVHARALLLELRHEEAAREAERALEGTERHHLMPELIDSLITRGTALGDLGRRVEARLLLDGAIDLADRHDLSHAAIRARINLSHVFGSTDPEASHRAILAGFNLARKVGNRAFLLFAANNLAGSLGGRGELEQAIELLDDPLLEDAPDHYRATLLTRRANVMAMRGETDAARRHLAEARELAAVETDVQTTAQIDAQDHVVSLMEGQWEEAFRGALELIRWDWVGMFYASGPAVMAAAFSANPAWVEETAEALAAYPADALADDLHLLDILGGLARGEDRLDDARALAARFDDTVRPGWAVSTLASAARFLPHGHPDREQLLDDARARMEELGFNGLVALLDQPLP